VLYTYEVDRRVKQAMIVHRGKAVDGGTGWYVESWARCDWAELPAALGDALGLEVWTDPSGRRVATGRVVSSRGPEHCDWQDMTFLSIDGGDLADGQTYVEHPQSELYPGHFAVPYDRSTDLPPTPATPATNATAATYGWPLTEAEPSLAPALR